MNEQEKELYFFPNMSFSAYNMIEFLKLLVFNFSYGDTELEENSLLGLPYTVPFSPLVDIFLLLT